MSGAWLQNLIAGGAVLAALGYLVGRRLRRRTRAAMCENCPGANPVAGARRAPMPTVLQTLVTIDNRRRPSEPPPSS